MDFSGKIGCVVEGGKKAMLFQNEKSRAVLIALLNEKSRFSVDIILGSATIVTSGSITT